MFLFGSTLTYYGLKGYLNNLEHDRNEPRFTTILLLADAIGMDPGELVNAAAALSWAALTEEEGALGEMEEG